MLSRRLNLLQEDACLCLYGIASTNWEVFYNSTLPNIIRSSLGISSEAAVSQLTALLNSASDLPSFQRCFLDFVNDFHVYLLTA